MVALDTDFLIDLLNHEESAVEKAGKIETEGERKTVTPVTLAEILEGAHYLGGKYLDNAIELVKSLELLTFDFEAANEAGRIGAELSKEGKQIGIADMMIAGIVKRHSEILLTRDEHFTRVKGLRIERH